MSKKKKFNISQTLTQGICETIQVVENHASEYRNCVLPLERIEIDPDNPRDLILTEDDILKGPNKSDPQYERKCKEFDGIVELAESIKTSGLLHPILVYKYNQNYRIVAGERRYLASKRLGKEVIESRVFNTSPKGFNRKLVQWFENQARVDLTLLERVNNMRDILITHKEEYGQEPNAVLLSELTGLSRPQCIYYLGLIQAPDDVIKAIELGEVASLDKAYIISTIPDSEQRSLVLEAAKGGASLTTLKGIIKNRTLNQTAKLPSKGRGRIQTRVNMGSTTEKKVVKFIVDLVSAKLEEEAVKQLQEINWDDLKDISVGFKKLINILEKTIRVSHA